VPPGGLLWREESDVLPLRDPLERGLHVLRVLSSGSLFSLQDLHAATSIPKPSLLRILTTLGQAGLVSRRLADGLYRASAFSPSGRKADRFDRVAEAAAPILDDLCQKVLWPSDLMVPAGNYMERRETSQAGSPFFPHRTNRNRVGQRVGWLLTGTGRAYLAFCPKRERERILQRLRASRIPADLLARHPERLEAIWAQTRQRGFAIRDNTFAGGSYGDFPFDDGLAAIAVPLLGRKQVYGAINILWIKTAFTFEEFAAEHLHSLQHAASMIVAQLETRDAAAAVGQSRHRHSR
jgi:IclR family mhp operon transcriptional activator